MRAPTIRFARMRQVLVILGVVGLTGSVASWHLAVGADTAGSRQDLDRTSRELSAAEADTRADDLADLRGCLNGVVAATNATRAGDASAAVALLQAALDACSGVDGRGAGDGVLFPFDFADPSVVLAGGTYYAYATNSTGGAIQLIRSTDLRHWKWVGEALAGVPAWAEEGFTWAPAVVQLGDQWLLYYAAMHRDRRMHCISVATAASPSGPFVDRTTAPVVCDWTSGGSIDPTPFVTSDGSAYLLWKTEGEGAGGVAQLRSQRLRFDGLAVQGPPAVLLQTAEAWEGRTIEAPSMVDTSAGLVLAYSGNAWSGPEYAMGAAICDSPLGPCRRQDGGPLLRSHGAATGPGGGHVFIDASGAARVAYHAWQDDEVGWPHGRFLHIGKLLIRDGRVVLTG
jgi:predicted GH43/DUF377 family glycosyl hydrolase